MNNPLRHLRILSLSIVLGLISTMNQEGIAFTFETPPTSATFVFNEFPFIIGEDSTTSDIEASIKLFADENGQGDMKSA